MIVVCIDYIEHTDFVSFQLGLPLVHISPLSTLSPRLANISTTPISSFQVHATLPSTLVHLRDVDRDGPLVTGRSLTFFKLLT